MCGLTTSKGDRVKTASFRCTGGGQGSCIAACLLDLAGELGNARAAVSTAASCLFPRWLQMTCNPNASGVAMRSSRWKRPNYHTVWMCMWAAGQIRPMAISDRRSTHVAGLEACGKQQARVRNKKFALARDICSEQLIWTANPTAHAVILKPAWHVRRCRNVSISQYAQGSTSRPCRPVASAVPALTSGLLAHRPLT